MCRSSRLFSIERFRPFLGADSQCMQMPEQIGCGGVPVNTKTSQLHKYRTKTRSNTEVCRFFSRSRKNPTPARLPTSISRSDVVPIPSVLKPKEIWLHTKTADQMNRSAKTRTEQMFMTAENPSKFGCVQCRGPFKFDVKLLNFAGRSRRWV